MNKSKYITYTTMALVAFIIIEMNLFTFMFVKGQDEKEIGRASCRERV